MTDESAKRRAVVGEEAEGERLDLWLARSDGELSRSRAQKLIAAGLVRVKGELRPSRHRLSLGDVVEWEVPPPAPTIMEAEAQVAFRIVHEDEDLAVIDKPAGLVVHPAPGHPAGTLVHGLLAQLEGLSAVGGVQRPGIVHRLDKDTSGLMVVAKNDRCHQALQAQLKDHSLRRIYRAICWGVPSPLEGTIEAPLGRHPRDRKRQAVVRGGRSCSYPLQGGGGAARRRLTTSAAGDGKDPPDPRPSRAPGSPRIGGRALRRGRSKAQGRATLPAERAAGGARRCRAPGSSRLRADLRPSGKWRVGSLRFSIAGRIPGRAELSPLGARAPRAPLAAPAVGLDSVCRTRYAPRPPLGPRAGVELN